MGCWVWVCALSVQCSLNSELPKKNINKGSHPKVKTHIHKQILTLLTNYN